MATILKQGETNNETPNVLYDQAKCSGKEKHMRNEKEENMIVIPDEDELGKTRDVKYSYHDYAHINKDLNPAQTIMNKRVIAQGTDQRFPSKVYVILSTPRFSNIISWLSHGRSWKIHNVQLLEKDVLPIFFDNANYNSFIRLVNAWCFRRIRSKEKRGQADYNSYFHELFLRGMPNLTQKLKRSGKHSQKLPLDESSEPNFDDFPPMPDLSPSEIALSYRYGNSKIRDNKKNAIRPSCGNGADNQQQAPVSNDLQGRTKLIRSDCIYAGLASRQAQVTEMLRQGHPQMRQGVDDVLTGLRNDVIRTEMEKALISPYYSFMSRQLSAPSVDVAPQRLPLVQDTLTSSFRNNNSLSHLHSAFATASTDMNSFGSRKNGGAFSGLIDAHLQANVNFPLNERQFRPSLDVLQIPNQRTDLAVNFVRTNNEHVLAQQYLPLHQKNLQLGARTVPALNPIVQQRHKSRIEAESNLTMGNELKRPATQFTSLLQSDNARDINGFLHGIGRKRCKR